MVRSSYPGMYLFAGERPRLITGGTRRVSTPRMRVAPMSDELAGKTIGERIQIIRERTGKSRPVVAGLVGRSPEWLKAIEKNRRQPPRLDMLMQLGEVLGV